MAGRSSRNKGKTGERAVRDGLKAQGFDVFPRPRGEAGDDFTVIDRSTGRVYSVEVKNTNSLEHSYFRQCKAQAKAEGRENRMLFWGHPNWEMEADSWDVFVWEKGRRYGRKLEWRPSWSSFSLS